MILGKKVGMTQIFENEKLIPVTVIEAGSNFIVQIKTEEKEGYNSITLAFDDKKEKNIVINKLLFKMGFDKMMPSDYNKKPAKLFGIVKDE